MQSLIKYFQSVVEETKAVNWPSRKKVINDTMIVVGALIFSGTFIALVDYGLTELLKIALTSTGV